MIKSFILHILNTILPYGDNKNIESVTGKQHFNRKFIKLIIIIAINIIIHLNIYSIPIIIQFRIIALNIMVFCLLDLILPSIGDINNTNITTNNSNKLIRSTIRILLKIMIICNSNILVLNNYNLVKYYSIIIVPNIIIFMLLHYFIPSIKRNSIVVQPKDSTPISICMDLRHKFRARFTSEKECNDRLEFLVLVKKEMDKINKDWQDAPSVCQSSDHPFRQMHKTLKECSDNYEYLLELKDHMNKIVSEGT